MESGTLFFTRNDVWIKILIENEKGFRKKDRRILPAFCSQQKGAVMNGKHLIGISSYTFPYACAGFPDASVLQAEDLIDKAQELGVHCVQYGDNMPLEYLDDERLSGLGQKAEDAGIVLEAGMRHASKERLIRYINIAERMGARLLRVIIDDRKGEFEPAPREVTGILREILPMLEEKNIILGIENHDRFTAEQYAEVIQDIGSGFVGTVTDTTNSLSNEESCAYVLEKLAPFCVCLHVKDYKIARLPGGLGLSVTGTCLGEGRMDCKVAIETADRLSGHDFNIILESWMQPCETPEETLRQEADWAERGVRLLKMLLGQA